MIRVALTATILLGAAALALGLAGCASSSPYDVLVRDTQVLDTAMIRQVLRKAPVPPDKDFHAETLLASDEFSAHLLQYRTREQRHIHRRHDLTFIVHHGEGELYINDQRKLLEPGAVFHIPRATPHYCINTGSAPLAAVLIFTPPFDLKDSIPAPREARSRARERESR